MNKKGLSEVVATVLIILLVIAGVVLLWSPIKRMIQGSTEQAKSPCLFVESTITDACYNGSLVVTISNGPDDEVDAYQIIYGAEGYMTSTYETPSGLDKNQEGTFSFDATGNTTTISLVKVAPVVDGQTCDATESRAITAC